MTKKLQHLFALSEKGAKDLVKAVIWCFVCNLSLMFPVGAVLFTVQHLLDSMENGGSPMDDFWIYAGFGIAAVSYTHLSFEHLKKSFENNNHEVILSDE